MIKYIFGPKTQLIHGNHRSEDQDMNSHAFPIVQTSTFRFNSTEEGKRIFSGKSHHDAYSRISNPNHRFLEERLCILEGGQAAQVFDSGMTAIKVLFMSLLRSGNEIVAHRSLYGGTDALLKELTQFGIKTHFVDAKNIQNVFRAITEKTKLIFLETPSNQTLDICDFEAIKKELLDQDEDLLIAVDNTFATPCNQKPLQLGADIVVESLTKYINGLGNYIGGAIITSKELMDKIWERYHASGGMMDPETASRISTNMMTLYDRMNCHNRNGKIVANFLTNKIDVKKVYYPGLSSHPNHDVARRLMTGFGGVVSFELKEEEKSSIFLDQLASDRNSGKGIISLSVSLGSVDSLICCPALSTHLSLTPESRAAQGISDGLVRFSAGIEDVEDIIYSLERGFRAINGGENW